MVWRKKDSLVIYRGTDHRSKSFSKMTQSASHTMQLNVDDTNIGYENLKVESDEEEHGMIMGDEAMGVNGSLLQRETDRLLDGLGPRFEDWWMRKPLPIDADLLPEEVPGFKPPFRLCPTKNRSKLSDKELTYLRNLAKPLPTHFVLGIFSAYYSSHFDEL